MSPKILDVLFPSGMNFEIPIPSAIAAIDVLTQANLYKFLIIILSTKFFRLPKDCWLQCYLSLK
jgi:hypothetical protein